MPIEPRRVLMLNSDSESKSGAVRGRERALAESGGGPRDDWIAGLQSPVV